MQETVGNGVLLGETTNDPTMRVYLTLRQWIVEKKLEPGSKINQVKLADEFGVSRTPVVKALHKLATEGLVDTTLQKGFYVHQLTIKELLELFTLREAIDTIVVNSIIRNVRADQIAILEGLILPFRDIGWTAETAAAYLRADYLFHRTFVDFCDNDLAKRINESFQVLNRTYRAGLLRPPSLTFHEHVAIIDALKVRNAEAARLAVSNHIGFTKQMLQSMVDKLGELGIDPARLPIQEAFNTVG